MGCQSKTKTNARWRALTKPSNVGWGVRRRSLPWIISCRTRTGTWWTRSSKSCIPPCLPSSWHCQRPSPRFSILRSLFTLDWLMPTRLSLSQESYPSAPSGTASRIRRRFRYLWLQRTKLSTNYYYEINCIIDTEDGSQDEDDGDYKWVTTRPILCSTTRLHPLPSSLWLSIIGPD